MRAAVVVLMLSFAVVACGPDLGQCDEQAAKTIVYLNGIPYTEGQALIQQSCAGSFCHVKAATGLARGGAPHGLDFDVAPVTKSSVMANLVALQNGIGTVREEADEIWAAVEDGSMPPGKAGDRPDLPWKRDAAGTMDAMLTGVDLDEARQKVRNWLACAAPIVAATEDSPLKSAAAPLGATEPAGMGGIEPTLASIQEKLFVVQCSTCHKGAGSLFPSLDFTSADSAFATLVGKDALAGGACSGSKLVVPNDCQNSLLYQKLFPEGQGMNACGDPMPLSGTSPDETTRKAVCDWIMAGAMK